jgi:hypothetical protein
MTRLSLDDNCRKEQPEVIVPEIPMTRPISVLDQVRIASPCPVRWDTMAGDERVRYCSQCRLHVFNLSNMSRREAEDLIQSKEGRLCVRYYQRADGGVMTRDCPIALRDRLRRAAVMALGLSLTLLAGVLAWAHLLPDRREDRYGSRLRQREPFRTVLEWIDPSPPLLGVICPTLMPLGGVPSANLPAGDPQ